MLYCKKKFGNSTFFTGWFNVMAATVAMKQMTNNLTQNKQPIFKVIFIASWVIIKQVMSVYIPSIL